MHLTNQKLTVEQTLLAVIADRLSFLAWAQTTDARKNANRPESILAMLRGENVKNTDFEVFKTAEEFEVAYKKLLEEK